MSSLIERIWGNKSVTHQYYDIYEIDPKDDQRKPLNYFGTVKVPYSEDCLMARSCALQMAQEKCPPGKYKPILTNDAQYEVCAIA